MHWLASRWWAENLREVEHQVHPEPPVPAAKRAKSHPIPALASCRRLCGSRSRISSPSRISSEYAQCNVLCKVKERYYVPLLYLVKERYYVPLLYLVCTLKTTHANQACGCELRALWDLRWMSRPRIDRPLAEEIAARLLGLRVSLLQMANEVPSCVLVRQGRPGTLLGRTTER